MAKQRSVTGFGPTVLSLSTTGYGSWQRFGPFKGTNFAAQGIFTATSAGDRCVVQGSLTTASTGGAFTLVTLKSSVKTMVFSTNSNLAAFVRLHSTHLKASGTVAAHFAALA